MHESNFTLITTIMVALIAEMPINKGLGSCYESMRVK